MLKGPAILSPPGNGNLRGAGAIPRNLLLRRQLDPC